MNHKRFQINAISRTSQAGRPLVLSTSVFLGTSQMTSLPSSGLYGGAKAWSFALKSSRPERYFRHKPLVFGLEGLTLPDRPFDPSGRPPKSQRRNYHYLRKASLCIYRRSNLFLSGPIDEIAELILSGRVEIEFDAIIPIPSSSLIHFLGHVIFSSCFPFLVMRRLGLPRGLSLYYPPFHRTSALRTT